MSGTSAETQSFRMRQPSCKLGPSEKKTKAHLARPPVAVIFWSWGIFQSINSVSGEAGCSQFNWHSPMISNLMLSATQNFKAGPVDPSSQSAPWVPWPMPHQPMACRAAHSAWWACWLLERPQLRTGTEIPKKQLQASLDYWEMRGIDVLRVGGMTGD